MWYDLCLKRCAQVSPIATFVPKRHIPLDPSSNMAEGVIEKPLQEKPSQSLPVEDKDLNTEGKLNQNRPDIWDAQRRPGIHPGPFEIRTNPGRFFESYIALKEDGPSDRTLT